MSQILTDLKNMGGEKVFSLELFNRAYWEEDPLLVAKNGLAKMKFLVMEIAGFIKISLFLVPKGLKNEGQQVFSGFTSIVFLNIPGTQPGAASSPFRSLS